MADAEELLKEQAQLGAQLRSDQAEAVRAAREELRRKQELEDRIAKRKAVLSALEAQPDWFNYVAAFGASIVSTLIMHPVDTLKTRQISSAGGGDGSISPLGPPDGLVGSVQPVAPPPSLGRSAPPGASPSGGHYAATASASSPSDDIVASTASSTADSTATTTVPAPAAASVTTATATAATAAKSPPISPIGSSEVELDGSEESGTVVEELSTLASAANVETKSEANLLSTSTTEGEWSMEDYLSLYQGISGALFKEGPPSALYLGVYEAVKAQLLTTTTLQPLVVYLIAGALGETFGSIIRAPAEAVKARVQSGLDPSASDSVQRVLVDADGRANVLRAWSSSLWRDVPFGAIQLAIFEGLKSYIINSPGIEFDIDTLAAEALLGATGGAIGSFLSTPMDVITIRIITRGSNGEGAETLAPVGFLGMAKIVWAEGGLSSFFTGWKERVLYWAPAIGIFLSCYCSFRQAAIAQGFFQ